MAEYRDIRKDVQAVRWNRIGDPVGDRPLFKNDLREVVPYKREGIADTTPCVHCTRPMKEHGWMDAPPTPVTAAAANLRVNPATGEHTTAPAPPAPVSYPKLYERSTRTPGKDPLEKRTVTSPAEEHQAVMDGFHFVSAVKPAEQEREDDELADEREHTATGYPKTLVRKAPKAENAAGQAPDDTLIVYDPAEEEAADARGFVRVPVEDAKVPLTDDQVRAESEAGYPKSLVKYGAPNKVVHNEGDEEKAVKDGYASGVVICPGNFVVRLPSGQLETMGKTYFDTYFHRI